MHFSAWTGRGRRRQIRAGFFRADLTTPVVVLLATILLVLLEDALLLPGRRLCWDGCRSYQVRKDDKGVVGDASVLLGRKDDPEVPFLTSAKVALVQRRIRCQELIYLLDDRVVGIACALGK